MQSVIFAEKIVGKDGLANISQFDGCEIFGFLDSFNLFAGFLQTQHYGHFHIHYYIHSTKA